MRDRREDLYATCRNGKRITSDTRGYPHAVKLVILNELGVLNDRQLTLYDWFRKLRNRAAHEPLFALESGDLAKFQAKYRSPAQLPRICQSLVIGMWNLNNDVLKRIFTPGLNAFYDQQDAERARSGHRKRSGRMTFQAPELELMGPPARPNRVR